MDENEFMNFLTGMVQGKPVNDAMLKIDDETVLKSVLCASIDTWCHTHGGDPIAIVTEMLNAMVSVHEKEDAEDDAER